MLLHQCIHVSIILLLAGRQSGSLIRREMIHGLGKKKKQSYATKIDIILIMALIFTFYKVFLVELLTTHKLHKGPQLDTTL